MTDFHSARSDGNVRRTLLALLGVLVAAGPLVGQEAPPDRSHEAPAVIQATSGIEDGRPAAEERPGARHQELPPLLDRQLFFGDPRYAGAQISPDGEWISFRQPYREVMNVWVKRTDEPFDAARPVTSDTTRPVQSYFWTRDSERILYAQDKGGNENFHVYAVDPSAAPETEDGPVPEARDLTPYDNIQARIYAVPDETPNEIVVGLNDRDPQVHDVYRLDLETGERTLVVRNDQQIAGWQTDLDGKVRLAVRQTETGGTEILTVAGEPESPEFEVVYECNWRESCGPARFHPDGRRVYLVSNKGDDVDLSRLLLLDTRTGETELVESDPEGEVDFGGALFSDRTDELLATTYVGDRRRIYPKTEWFRESLEFLRAELPEGELGFSASTRDESRMLVSVSSDVDPGSVYLYDREEGAVERLYRSRPDLPSEHLASMEAIRYEARDGREISAYLTLPQGVDHENLPLVVHPHGGPWARDTWGYATYPQFLANRGYAVLQPNFRGSTGYGKDFLNAGNEEWGDAMQDDITDGVRHLVEQGIVDPDRVGIFGGSYGGYATLAGLAFTPEVYAAGASYVGPSNIITLIEAIPPYWGPIAEIFAVRVGDLDDPEDRERLRRQSPLFSADAIDDPLLVIQGANDPRVDKRESDQIVVAARENGVDVRYLVAPEEGHGFARENNRLAVAAALEEFFAQHLGGRHQEDATPAVRERLDALRVETDTVSMPDTASDAEAEAAATAPLPEADGSRLEPTRLSYDITIAVQGQEIGVQASRTLTTGRLDGRDLWVVVEESRLPQGTSLDSLSLDRQRLTPVRRRVSGPFTVDLRYTPESISGSLAAQGNEIPIQTDLEAPVLAGSLNLEIVLASLSLEEGWETTVRTYNVQQQQVRTHRLEVTGTETVDVPAGETSTFVVEATPLGDAGQEATYWVRRDGPHHTVRSETQLPPAMGGATVTSELTSVEAPGGS